ncbi:MAG: aminotransferase class I/II-fold pyridoxal phosphate-dependent enzyme, partial [Firmicutes bacterium]|nr:aminotransferase class I/II-fold pyridoxal phosphate-dependent enzyme [Bacillota bacterium]
MSKSYVNKDILNMPKSGIRKFFDIASHMDDVVSLGVGEPDFETPWNIREAAISTLEKGRTSYTANQGLMELRSAICGYLSEKFKINYDPEKEI